MERGTCSVERNTITKFFFAFYVLGSTLYVLRFGVDVVASI